MNAETSYRAPERLARTLWILTGVGLAGGAAGFAIAPDRAWANLLLVSFWLTCMGVAGSFFVALGYACGAGWNVAFRRIPEAMMAALPVGAAGLLAVLLLHPEIYPWMSHNEAAGFRAAWLDYPSFLVRALVYIALWLVFSIVLIRNSRLQDRDGAYAHTRANIRTSVIFLVIFALTFWLASVDWIMSLEPEWYSTIFGVYHFAGMFVAGLAAMILLMLWFRRSAPLRDFITREHLHDAGKLLFAFSTFWMYIFFSQYMLIWYANMTEETVYYIRRQNGILGILFIANVVLNWGVPFLILLSSAAKRKPAVIGSMAMLVLLGRWLDLYLMILPAVTKDVIVMPWIEASMMLAAAGAFGLAFLACFRTAAQVPVRDPLLSQSLSYHS